MRRAFACSAFLGVATALKSQESVVSQVVIELQKMQVQLQTEQENADAVKKRMDCWCKNTKKTAGDNKSTAGAEITNQEAAIQTETGTQASSQNDADRELDAKNKAEEDLEAMRQRNIKQREESSTTIKELNQSIVALKGAINVLNKHHEGSFLQTTAGRDLKNVAGVLSTQLVRYSTRHSGEIPPSQRQHVQAFLSQPTASAYNSQSGEIFGILQQMLDDFEADLAAEEQNDVDNKKAYEEEHEITTELRDNRGASYIEKSKKATEAAANLAAAQTALTRATEQRSSAQELLDETVKNCDEAEKLSNERRQLRAEELLAVRKALGILDNSDALAKFTGVSLKASLNFFQKSAVAKKSGYRARAHMATKRLLTAGLAHGNKKMVALAQVIKVGVFDKVIHAIDVMVESIQKQITTDSEDKESCIKELHDQATEIQAQQNELEKTENEITILAGEMERLAEERKALEENTVFAKNEQAEMGQLREQENKAFQTTVKEQNEAMDVMNQALTVLKAVFDQAALVQTGEEPVYDEAAGAPEAASGKLQGRAEKGNVVLDLLVKIITDTQHAKDLAVQGESEQQKAYEQTMQTWNTQIKQWKEELTKKEMEHADEKAKKTSKEHLAGEQGDSLTIKQKGRSTQEKECKFLLDNFDIRLQHFNEEIDALTQANAFLNGMGDAPGLEAESGPEELKLEHQTM